MQTHEISLIILNKTIIIAVIIAIIVASAIVSASYFIQKPSSQHNQWITSGPFSINKPQYKLGEDVFIVVQGLKPSEAGNMIFIRPGEKTWAVIPFNGTLKSAFNYYVKPDTSKTFGIYKAEDLVGEWKVVFKGVKYDPIHFEFINEFIPGGQADLVPINNNTTKVNGTGK